MSAQTSYGYISRVGAAGGLVDLTPHSISSFLNGEEDGAMRFGYGVVQGSNPGVNIALPTADSTAAQFEGITTNNRTTEFSLDGKLNVRNTAAVGVITFGRVYACVAEDVSPSYGDGLYLITDGEEAGRFTNAAGSGDPKTIAVKGRFIGGVDSTAQIAPVELFNQAKV